MRAFVVVLYQRLWGTTPSTEAEAAAVKARIGKLKRKDVLIVPLDTSARSCVAQGNGRSLVWLTHRASR